MPTIAELFREGRLSYSKVREVTRVVDVVDEVRLAGLALTATASQLARMISGFRTADGLRISQQTQRKVSWHELEDGMIGVSGSAAQRGGCCLTVKAVGRSEPGYARRSRTRCRLSSTSKTPSSLPSGHSAADRVRICRCLTDHFSETFH
jgi:hypothetical protein